MILLNRDHSVIFKTTLTFTEEPLVMSCYVIGSGEITTKTGARSTKLTEEECLKLEKIPICPKDNRACLVENPVCDFCGRGRNFPLTVHEMQLSLPGLVL